MSWVEIKIISLDDYEESESRNILTLVLHGSHIQNGSGGGKEEAVDEQREVEAT